MPTLNIDVNARVEKAKRDLRQLDKEVLKISNSEKILERAMQRAGDVGAKEFKKLQSGAVKQAKAVNSAAIQFKQLRAQMVKLGAAPAAIGKITTEFVKFRMQMERGVVSTTAFQKAQDRLRATMAGTKRQLAKNTVEVKKIGKVGHDSKKSLTGLNTTLENLGSTAVLIAGPLSGVGSRLIAFGAIAKRGSLGIAAMFVVLAAVTTMLVKSIKQFAKLDSYLHRVNAVLQATGKSAKFTAEQINKVAASVARTTLASLEEARQGAALLISSPGVDQGNFERALRLSQDIAAQGFMDITRAARLLGRALDDPIANMDSMKRAGVQLDFVVKKNITSLQNFGETAKAAALFMDEVEKRVGGAGKGANVGMAGAVDELGQSWDELQEKLGDSSFYTLVVGGINNITRAMDWLGDSVKGAGKGILDFVNAGRSLLGNKQFLPPPPKQNSLLNLMGPSGKPPLAPISKFDDALIKAQEKANLTMMLQENAIADLSKGYSLIHPNVLKLASSYGVLDKATATLNGEQVAMTREMARTMGFLEGTNKTSLEMADSIKATSILLNNRTPIEKYNDALRGLIHLHKVGKVSVTTFNRELKRLRETLFSKADVPEEEPPNKFNDALIKAQEKASLSMMVQKKAIADLFRGYSLIHPAILRMAAANGMLDETLAMLSRGFKATTPEMAKMAESVNKTNKALLEMEKSTKGNRLFLNARTATRKYGEAIRALTNLYNENIITAFTFARTVPKLREAFATPEVKAMNSALSTFSDKLADATVKGKNFVDNLKAAFKGLVDDILKQFLKLAVINPIMNSIFGKIPSRPELGQEEGGMLGIGGMFGEKPGSRRESQNAPSFKAMNDNYKEKGLTAVEEYGNALQATNDGILEKGSKFTSGLGSTFSGILDSIGGSVGTAVGGGIGSFLGHKFADLLGFQHGGQFKVGGVGGADSKLVAFKATPGETVSVDTPGQQKKGGNVTYIDARGVDPGQMDRLIKVIRELDSSIEVRAVNAVTEARFDNPSLLGRVA